MLETNKQIQSGDVKEEAEDDQGDNYDQNGFLKVDAKHIKKVQPMTIEVWHQFSHIMYIIIHY